MTLDIQPKTSGDVISSADFNEIVSVVNANEAAINDKVDKEQGKGLSTNDYTTEEKEKLAGVEVGAEVNTVTSVAGKTGGVTLVKGDVGLGNVDNTSDLDKPVSNPTLSLLCPRTETTSLTITDAVSYNAIDYTIYGNTGGVGDLVVDGDSDYAEYRGKYRIPVKVSGVNLFDTMEFEGISIIPNVGNGTFTIRGRAMNGPPTHRAILDHLEVGKTYYAKWDIISGTPENNFMYVWGSARTWANGGTHTITQADKENNIGINIYGSWNGSASVEDVVYANFIISEVNTPFEPYIEPQTVNIYWDEPLGDGQSISLADTNVPIQLSQYTNIIGFGTEVQPSGWKVKYYQNINAGGIVTQSSPSAIVLKDNTEYYLTDVGTLTFEFPTNTHWQALAVLETVSSGTVTIAFPQDTVYIGETPTFDNDEIWEISIRDGVVVAGKAVSAS